MEWEWQIKFRLGNWAILRRKDKFFKEGDRRWRFGKYTDGFWCAL